MRGNEKGERSERGFIFVPLPRFALQRARVVSDALGAATACGVRGPVRRHGLLEGYILNFSIRSLSIRVKRYAISHSRIC